MTPAAAAILLAAVGAAALLADRLASVAAISIVLLALVLRAPSRRRRLYLYGALSTGAGIMLLWPLLAVEGTTTLWVGPTLPVLGPLDVTVEELHAAAVQGLRVTALALAFSVYALLLDHDRLLGAVGFARRSALAVALATRLVPTLERDAAGLAEAVRGRGVAVQGARGYASLLSPLVAGSLERAWNLAESMEARGYGSGRATRAPRPAWTGVDLAAVLAAAALLLAGVLWL